eukprot:g4233.t1
MASLAASARTTRKIPAALAPDTEDEKWNDGSSSPASANAAAPALTKRSSNPRVMSFIRDDWIRRQMLEREAEFTAFRKMSVFVGTFNANGKKPVGIRAGIVDWLRDGNSGRGSAPLADIYVIGFQEIVDLSAANVLADGQSASRTTTWAELVHQTLNQLANEGSAGSMANDEFGFSASDSNAGGNATEADTSVGAYHLIEKKNMVGIALLVYVKAEHVTYVQDVQGVSIGVGLMGVMGNKGACAVRMQLYDSTLCFVSAHLAAHRGNVQGRNADFANIIDKAQFKEEDAYARLSAEEASDELHDRAQEAKMGGRVSGDSSDSVTSGRGGAGTRDDGGETNGSDGPGAHIPDRYRVFAGSAQTGEFGILDHDYVFWLGDLNYRMQKDVSLEECYYRMKQKDFGFLRANDQLNAERANDRCFSGFEEGTINFLPTYKFIPGTDRYDDREDKKLRVPAWCDRILWKCSAGNDTTVEGTITKLIALELYNSSSSIKISDHKPVLGMFGVQLKTTVREQQRRVYGEIMRALDTWENECIPKVEIEGGELFFHDLRFRVRQSRKIKITNSGQVSATFRFVPKLEEKHICKPWLSLKPPFAMLLPSESLTVTVDAYVDARFANGLDYGREVLDDILVLRLENGRDHFITVAGTYVPSCFGTSLARLVCTPGPMSQASDVNAISSNADSSLTAGTGVTGAAPDPVLSVPKEIWHLVDALYRRTLLGSGSSDGTSQEMVDSLFVESGSSNEIASIRKALDESAHLDELIEAGAASTHSLAEALLQLLDSLSDSIVPIEFWPQADFDHDVSIARWSSNFLAQLPTMNYNVFVYIVAFLRELVATSVKAGGRNVVLAQRLSTLFSRMMVRVPYLHSFWDYGPSGRPRAISNARGSSMNLKQFVGASDTDRIASEGALKTARKGMCKVLEHFLTASEFR